MAVVEVLDSKYHMDDKLIKRWDKIRNGKLTKYDEDRSYIVDGREGTGKSLFTIQQAAYIDPTIIQPEEAKKRITFEPLDFLKAIRETKSNPKETKVVIFDEAFRGLSSRTALSKTNKLIVQGLMEMRQNNLVVFIVLPSFFMLDLYPAMLRSNALFHIVKERFTRKRAFYLYNYSKKGKLYQDGVKKGWKYNIQTRFCGRFYNKYPGGDDFENLYRKMKSDSLINMEKLNIQEPKHDIWKEKFIDLAVKLHNTHRLTLKETAEELTRLGHEVSYGTVRNYLKSVPQYPQPMIKS